MTVKTASNMHKTNYLLRCKWHEQLASEVITSSLWAVRLSYEDGYICSQVRRPILVCKQSLSVGLCIARFHVAIMICANLVNIHTDAQTALTSYTISS